MNGVATAITPMAFYETVMAKGYETLVGSDTKVDVNTGMIASGRLQALIESRASGTSMVDMAGEDEPDHLSDPLYGAERDVAGDPTEDRW